MPRLSARQTNWYIEGRTLRKDYEYHGLNGDDHAHHVRIDVDVTPSLVGGHDVHVFILINPHFWPDEPDGSLIAQLALADQPLDAPFVVVRAGTGSDGTLIVSPIDRAGAQTFFDIIAEGREMRLTLSNSEEPLASFPIPNDERFHPMAKQFFAAHSSQQPPPPQSLSRSLLSRLFG